MSDVTVPGSTGSIVITGPTAQGLANAYAASIANAASTGTLISLTLTSGVAPAAPPGGTFTVAQAVISGGAGSYVVPTGYTDVVNAATGGVKLDLSTSITAVNVLASDAGTSIAGGAAGGTVALGGGNNQFIGETAGGGAYAIASGTGDDTILAGSGNDTIQPGTGSNFVETGSGNVEVFASGSADTILGGTGSDILATTGSSSTVFGGTGSDTVVDGGSSNVFVGGTGATTLYGGSDGAYYLNGATTVVAGASDTISASTAASVTAAIFGGVNTTVTETGSGALAFIATAGNNATITGGTTTAVYGADGSDITFVNSDTVPSLGFLVAGSGNETLDGSNAKGFLDLFGGSGNDVLIGGTNPDTLTAGTGSTTMTGGAGYGNLFAFNNGSSGGNAVINDFGSSAGNLVGLFGYGATAAATALASATAVGTTGSMITLSNHTTITFTTLDVASLQANATKIIST